MGWRKESNGVMAMREAGNFVSWLVWYQTKMIICKALITYILVHLLYFNKSFFEHLWWLPKLSIIHHLPIWSLGQCKKLCRFNFLVSNLHPGPSEAARIRSAVHVAQLHHCKIRLGQVQPTELPLPHEWIAQAPFSFLTKAWLDV